MEIKNKFLKKIGLNPDYNHTKNFILNVLIDSSNIIYIDQRRKFKLPSELIIYISWNKIYPKNLNGKPFVNFWVNAKKYGMSKSTLINMIDSIFIENKKYYEDKGSSVNSIII